MADERDGPDSQDTRDYYAHHDPDGQARLSTTLVHALADVMGADVTETGFVLADEIDPDALDMLFSSGSPGGPAAHVAFAVDDYRVTVYGDGTIVITPPAPMGAIPEQ